MNGDKELDFFLFISLLGSRVYLKSVFVLTIVTHSVLITHGQSLDIGLCNTLLWNTSYRVTTLFVSLHCALCRLYFRKNSNWGSSLVARWGRILWPKKFHSFPSEYLLFVLECFLECFLVKHKTSTQWSPPLLTVSWVSVFRYGVISIFWKFCWVLT